jgi:hypothetical protein
MENAKEIADAMQSGFKEVALELKELTRKLTEIEKAREYERGLELQKKVEANTKTVEGLTEWKATTDMSLVTWRRVSWALVGAVGTISLALIIALINYWIGKPR